MGKNINKKAEDDLYVSFFLLLAGENTVTDSWMKGLA
jgi:hypothetical protein